jgi:hypothetical protein
MTHTKRAAVLFAVVAVAVGMLAAPAAATSHVDSLAGDGTDHITNFNASSSDYITYTLSSDGTDFGTDSTDTVYLNVTVNDEHVQVSNSSISSTASSYTFNISHADLGTVPGDAGANTTITVNAWGEGADGSVNTSVDTFDATLGFHDEYAVVYAGNSAADGNVDGVSLDTMSDDPFLGISSLDDGASTTTEADNVGLGANASGTTVHVVVANTSSEDPFATAEEGGLLSSYDTEGAYMPTHQLMVEDTPHAVFNSEAPSALVDGYTYATVGDRGGHDAYAVHVDEDYEDESSLDVTTRANDEYGFVQKRSVRADAYGGWLNSLTASTATGGQLVA